MAARSARTRIRERALPRPAPPEPRATAVPRPALIAGLLFAGLWTVYVLNFRMLSAGDSLPTRLVPFSVLREGNLDLDEFSWERNALGRLPYYVHQAGEHIYSVTTIGTALAVTPLYILPAWWLASGGVGYDDVRARVLIVVMERIAAATLAALSASVLFLVLRRLTSWRWAFALALLYGIGTSTWSIASQALWPHAVSELCLVLLSAVLLTARPSRVALAGAGLVTALMLVNRPQTIVFALPALLFVWMHHRQHLLAFAAIPVLGASWMVAYNRAVFNGITGGYGGFRHFRHALLDGVAGLLVSPNRGLLVYTPIMVFACWAAVQVWRRPVPPWVRWLTIGLGAHLVLYGKFDEWWAGYTYGPRYFTDVLPVLMILLVYGLVPLAGSRAVQVIAAVLALYGVAVQAIGVYAADDRWNREPVPLEQKPERVWDWTDLQIVRAWRDGWRGGELASIVLGTITDPVAAEVKPLRVADLASTIVVDRLAPVVRRGEPVSGVITITNQGGAAWPAFSGEGVISARHLVFVLARWLSAGQPIPGSGDVLALPRSVAPGRTVRVPLRLAAPPTPGEVELELRMTQAIDGTRGLVSDNAVRVPVRVE